MCNNNIENTENVLEFSTLTSTDQEQLEHFFKDLKKWQPGKAIGRFAEGYYETIAKGLGKITGALRGETPGAQQTIDPLLAATNPQLNSNQFLNPEAESQNNKPLVIGIAVFVILLIILGVVIYLKNKN